MGFELLTFDPPSTTSLWTRAPLVITGSAAGYAGQNEVTRLVTTAGGGTFTYNARGTGATTSISGSASAATIQAALEARPGIGVGQVNVTGGPLGSSGTPVFVEWTGTFAQTQGTYVVNTTGTTGFAHTTSQAPVPASALSMEVLDVTPPASKPDWVGGADSEWQALADIPKHENRKITLRVRVAQQASQDLALDSIGRFVDRVRSAQSQDDGVPLQWAPADVTKNPVLFDVLNGDITGLPITWDSSDIGWFLRSPVFTVDLICKPYWRSSVEVISSATSTAAPITSMEVTANGDVPALGRIIVTDNATQTRRDVEWGVEGPATYDSTTSLILDSDNLATSGFAGTGTTRSGAYDPGAAGNSVIRASAVLTTPIAVCGTGALGHVGSYRVWGRFFFARATQAVRLAWRAGDGPYGNNPWAQSPGGDGTWAEVYLGTITVPTAVLSTQRWDGKVEAFENAPYTATPGALDVDYIRLTPVNDGFGRSVASYTYSPGTALLAYDQFTSITAGTVLNARAAPSGGSWVTSGSTTDFAAADHPVGGELESRATTGDTALGRLAILGTTNITAQEVSYVTALSAQPDFSTGSILQGVILRYVDSSNFLQIFLTRTNSYHALVATQYIAGVPSTLSTTFLIAPPSGTFIQGIAYATGFVIGRLTDTAGNPLAQITGYSTALATGGTLATGKPGIQDFAAYTGGSTTTRYYDNFQVSTPAPEPVVLNSARSMEFRHDGVVRYDSGGTFVGQPPSYRGSRVTFPPGVSRVAVAGRRVNLDSAVDDNVVDSTTVQVATRDRGLVVPR